ncbi:uncharacterized RING finger protein P32A8.03c [Clonorchis sinensis]|uniref:Uncharacterized RING finger protein P32A8.03c n=1 Tax=Clonorchis sinensis TaxID=79923 RepID=G7YKB9_CLOSI|nr:uncharacterized RING finger protein P32A8.03c [Clonorchis sinensis]
MAAFDGQLTKEKIKVTVRARFDCIFDMQSLLFDVQYLAADQTRRESDSTDVKGPRLSSYTVASLVSSNQSGKLPCCSICLADFEENDEIITLPCFHVYHQACVQPWLSSNGGCAVCRLAPMKLVRNMVELLDQFGIGKLTNASPTQLRKDLLKS